MIQCIKQLHFSDTNIFLNHLTIKQKDNLVCPRLHAVTNSLSADLLFENTKQENVLLFTTLIDTPYISTPTLYRYDKIQKSIKFVTYFVLLITTN